MKSETIVKGELAELDRRLTELDFVGLSAQLLGVQEVGVSPPFDNRFFNQFVNSPNFTKRL